MKAPSRIVTAALVPLILILVTAAWAQDPATLFINTGSGFLYNNELNPVSGNSFVLSENGNGGPDLLNPVLIILGIAGSGNTAPTLVPGGAVLSTSGLASISTWGLSVNPGTLKPGDNDAYANLGLTGTNGALGQNWTNWSGAYEQLLGVSNVPGNQFQLFVYALNLNPNLVQGGTVTVSFNSISAGTFIIAYGCTNSTCSAANPYTTPFTQTGFGDAPPPPPVPEPASMVLFGSGLIAAASMIRRRLQR